MNIAIIGATGMVGQKIIEVLQERNIVADEFYLFASEGEKGKRIKIFNRYFTTKVLSLEELDKLHIDYAFFAVENEIAKRFVPEFAKRKIRVIDNSNAFRRQKNVPLVAAGVNEEDLKKGKYIFANPNCSTIQLVIMLKPLHDKFKIKRVVLSTYQAVSGGGSAALLDLKNNTTNKFKYSIKNNLIPHIDDFLENGYTKEEDKVVFESRKILNFPELNITVTAVRVPIENSHSESVNIEFEKAVTTKKIKETLAESKGIVLVDEPENSVYPMPLFATGHDEVYVGRIRKDFSQKNTFNFWVVSDNLRRGAASNAVDIFQSLLKLQEEK